MVQITEDYVSFETAKLLKEKGFDWFCERFYDYYPETGEVHICGCDEHNNSRYDDEYSMPTLSLACKWLREIHGWHIWTEPCFDYDSNHVVYLAFVQNVADVHEYMDGRKNVFTYPQVEKAISEALKYCLEHLI